MAKDQSRSTSRPLGRTGAPPRPRRTGVRRERETLSTILGRAARSPNTAWALLISVAFAFVCGMLSIWAREQPLVAVGRVVNFTAIVRTPFEIVDTEATNREKELARQRTPRIYVGDERVVQEIETSIANLPRTFATVESADSLAPPIRRQFRPTPESLAAIREHAVDGGASAEWRRWTERLVAGLRRRPILEAATYQMETQRGPSTVEMRWTGRTPEHLVPSALVNLRDERQLAESMTQVARDAGFAEPALATVVNRLLAVQEPTAVFDAAATAAAESEAAQRVRDKIQENTVGRVIFTRGEVLSRAQYDLYARELKVFREQAERYKVWFRRASIMGAVAAITLALVGYVSLFSPRIKANPDRMAGLAALLAGALAVACWGSVLDPRLLMLTAVAPTVFVAVIIVIAYDQRVAMAMGVLHGVLVCIALDQQIGVFALMITGIGVAVWMLREIRERRTLIRMSLITGGSLALGTVLVALLDRPIIPATFVETIYNAAFAGGGGLLVGGITLFILPVIERAFDITTGMTLIELRDPKQPLLRELQQRAPGTYNHSLNVASLAEAAADAIGANALLTYVGALYHDIGKMNKPDYFVENQSGGQNRHDKLSPAMSLLVIVGHVKDGLELAREFGLPQSLHHFIEAHHGTTLVEYFYHRARQKAEGDAPGAGVPEPQEIEYRYPGPRPQTKEVAILMVADAVESATRAMVEPTPGRIEALVHDIANRRLLDGQFDECELTLRDLQLITDSIIKTLASIYHARIAYPSSASTIMSTAASGIRPAGGEEKRA